MKRALSSSIVLLAASLMPALAVPAHGQVSGRPVPSMSIFDSQMLGFMLGNGIEAGVLGIMRDGDIVYLRGFGSIDDGINMPENAMVRLASVTKPVTAAAIHHMIDEGLLGVDGENRRAFNLNGNNGLLTYNPWPNTGDNRLQNITVRNLLMHRGGWDRDVDGDHTYREREIASDMSANYPPGKTVTMRWILGQSLVNTPGNTYAYSNEGYLALGLIVTNLGPGSHFPYIRSRVFTDDMWVPDTEIEQARTFRENRNGREPWYRSSQSGWSVFTPFLISVNRPYGSVDIEARTGQGSVLASAPAMLHLGNAYHISPGSSLIGRPIDATNPLTGNESHNGALSGVNTILWRRTDGVTVFAFFNRNKGEVSSGHYGNDFINQINPILNAGTDFSWPNTTSDGFWVIPTLEFNVGFGNYNSPYFGIGNMLSKCQPRSKVRIKPGTSTWTGTIDKRLLIDAPEGEVVIGQQ